MNWDTAKGNWTLFKGTVKVHWSRLTHDHLGVIAGRHDQLTGQIQKGYGATRPTTKAQVKKFILPRNDRGRRI